jgi:murein DD-endopeptidase MepM/ murein hydrolase activator NlpD
MLLILSLAIYLPGARFYPVPKGQTAKQVPVEAENGVGGGMIPEKQVQAEVDLELTGVPEPEEYSRPHILTFSSYTLEKGDMIGNIALRAGLNEDTLISVNNIKNTRLMQIGQVIRIPNQDGIYYTVKAGDTLESIAEKYKTAVSHISTVNELFSDSLAKNASLFIPGAKMDWVNRQEINGDLFIWPYAGYITSSYGYRIAPFGGTRQFHSGLDIGAPMGAPIKAAMAGRVSQVGYDDSFGNYVVISHHSGYRTFYAHMSVVRVKAGVYVATGERIGDIGSTGLSTGPHLHFTVYKNGVTVNPRSLMK